MQNMQRIRSAVGRCQVQFLAQIVLKTIKVVRCTQEEILQPQIGATYYNTLLDKGSVIKEFAVFQQCGQDLCKGLDACARYAVWSLVVVRMAQVPQHPIDTCKNITSSIVTKLFKKVQSFEKKKKRINRKNRKTFI